MKTIYYLVYKLTNLVNNKIYIGCHMTKNLDDGYMGSGKRLHYAKKKYGIDNFKKEILSYHESLEEMLAEEGRLVNEEFINRKDVYNLMLGGNGSWFYVNQILTDDQRTKAGKAGGYANRTFEQRSISGKKGGQNARKVWNDKVKAGIIPHQTAGSILSDEHKNKISIANKGKPATLGMTGKHQSEEAKQKLREKRALQIMQPRSEETKLKIKLANAGKIWIKYPELNQRKMIHCNELELYLTLGWIRGMK